MPHDAPCRAEARVATPPGPLITALMLRLAVRSGSAIPPTFSAEGTHLVLAPRPLGGRGELIVTGEADGSGSCVVLRGEPPPWPLGVGWARRTLRRLLGGQPLTGRLSSGG